jgi:hypothetical protein
MIVMESSLRASGFDMQLSQQSLVERGFCGQGFIMPNLLCEVS